jgi:hypothetical protein
MNGTEALHPNLNRMQQWTLVVGLIASAICVFGAFSDFEQFLHSYLVAYLFWIGITLGCCAIVMLHNLTGGGWGLIVRRMLESATRTIPLMAILILPVLLGMPYLYVWAQPDAVAGSELLQHKSSYLNPTFFWIRTIFYFTVWFTLAYFLNKWSSHRDVAAEPKQTARLRALSAPGILIYAVTVTFASVDWVMSLEPEYFSTIYGMIFMVGQALTALAFVVGVAMLLANRKPLDEAISKGRLNDLGNLMLAFVMLWAYVAFSQFLIIWSGNLPEEITWYIHRLSGGWATVAVLLIVFHFALPFLFLLSRDVKRKMRRLLFVAAALIFMRWVDLFWLVKPAYSESSLAVNWMDFLTPIGVGGIWLATFIWQLKKRPLLPVNDPNFGKNPAHG